MKPQRGFTLIELMITVAIISVTMSIGLPSFQSIITDAKLTSTANAMLSAYQLMRIESIKTHSNTLAVKTSDDWKTWQVLDEKTNSTVSVFSASTGITVTKHGNVDGYSANGIPITASNAIASCGVANATPPTCGFTFSNAGNTNTRTLNIMTTGRMKISTP